MDHRGGFTIIDRYTLGRRSLISWGRRSQSYGDERQRGDRSIIDPQIKLSLCRRWSREGERRRSFRDRCYSSQANIYEWANWRKEFVYYKPLRNHCVCKKYCQKRVDIRIFNSNHSPWKCVVDFYQINDTHFIVGNPIKTGISPLSSLSRHAPQHSKDNESPPRRRRRLSGAIYHHSAGARQAQL